MTYRPSRDGQRSTYHVTTDDAEVIAAELNVAADSELGQALATARSALG